MTFSPYNPIVFYDRGTQTAVADVVHVFDTSDRIMVEVFHKPSETLPTLNLIDAHTDEIVVGLSWNTFPINSEMSLSFYELMGYRAGHYTLSFGDYISCPIVITDDASVLKKTTLLQYAIPLNQSRDDIYSAIKGRLRYFEARLYGGFKDEGWTFGVDNEQFLTDTQDCVEIQASESTEMILTIGLSDGYPIQLGEWLNRVIACPLLYIDGKRYAIPDNKAIDKTETIDNSGRFVFSAKFRQAKFIDAEFERAVSAIFRKIPQSLRRINGLRRI